MMDALRAPTGEGATLRWLCVVLAITLVARLVLAAALGLGVDEAYTVATARTWALSTFDHPPMAWWLAGGAAKLFGTEAPLAVRLPFILLCVASTWLIYDAGRTLFSAWSGLYAAVAFNLAPVLGWTSGSMVLPDGPLNAALLAGLCCLARAIFGDPKSAWRWWLLAGVAAGLACLSKLHGAVLFAGTGLYILTSTTQRHWLRSPWPYLAATIALLLFTPVLIWNLQHDWVSFAFQTGRAKASRFDPLGPFVALGGQALFLTPWVWVALMISLGRAASSGPQRSRDWLLFCLAIGPIAGFTLIAATGTKTLYHWAAPGYLFACVLLGRDLARDLAAADRRATLWLQGSITALAMLFVAVLMLTRLPWPALAAPGGKVVPYPLIETQSWSEVRDALAKRGLLGRTDTFIAALKWHEAGRIDVALRGAAAVRCLCTDARGYGVLYDNRAMLGYDAVIVTPVAELEAVWQSLPPFVGFQTITPSAPITISHGGQSVQTLHVYLATRLLWGFDLHPKPKP